MRHGVREMQDFTVGATDGEIGEVKDVYFDDEHWTIRYMVVETGGWLSGEVHRQHRLVGARGVPERHARGGRDQSATQYEIKSDKSDHVALHKGTALEIMKGRWHR